MAGPPIPAGGCNGDIRGRLSSKLSSRARGFLAHDAGKQPHAGIEQHHGGDLAAGQHVIADRDLFEAARLDDALVDALEAAADDDDAGTGREIAARGFGSAACRAGSSAAAGADRRRARPRRWPRRARRSAGPCRGRRRPAYRRRCGGGRCRGRGCFVPRATRSPAQRIAGERQAERAGKHLGIKGEDRGAEASRLVLVIGLGFARRCEQVVRRGRDRRAVCAMSTIGTNARVKGRKRRGAACRRLDFEKVAAAEIRHGHDACR